MGESSTTIELQGLLDRLGAGDASAKNLLVEKALDRLGMISRKLLRGFGGERRLEMWTAELIAEAYPRLSKAIDDVKPTAVHQFFGLARLQMHRTLLDLVRSKRPEAGRRAGQEVDLQNAPADLRDKNDVARQQMLVLDLLEAVAKLPEQEAETVWGKLAGYTHAEIGQMIGVHKDTVDRYWNKCCVKLAKTLSPFMDRL
jgi:RNA polymerase sigma factor (sigma-70 family)